MVLVLLSTLLSASQRFCSQSHRSRSHIYFCHLDIYWLNVWTWANQRRDTKIGKECKDIAFVINIYFTISTKRTTSQLPCTPKTQQLNCTYLWNFDTFSHAHVYGIIHTVYCRNWNYTYIIMYIEQYVPTKMWNSLVFDPIVSICLLISLSWEGIGFSWPRYRTPKHKLV